MNKNGWFWQFVKYAGVGIIGFILDLSLFYLFTRKFGVAIIPANIISVLIVIGHNFLWHKYLTFRIVSAKYIRKEFQKFFVISGSAFLVQQIGLPMLILLPAEQIFGTWEDFAAKFILVTTVGLTSFVLNRNWTFKDRPKTAIEDHRRLS